MHVLLIALKSLGSILLWFGRVAPLLVLFFKSRAGKKKIKQKVDQHEKTQVVRDNVKRLSAADRERLRKIRENDNG